MFPQLVNQLTYFSSSLRQEALLLPSFHVPGNPDLEKLQNLPEVADLERSLK